MNFEHIAIDVADPVAVAAWYVEHLGLRVARHLPHPIQAHFLTDDANVFCFEIYRNPAVETPDHHARDPLLFHVAFKAENMKAEKERLIAAGASFHDEVQRPDAHLVMLRDPWGIGLQLCRRTKPLV